MRHSNERDRGEQPDRNTEPVRERSIDDLDRRDAGGETKADEHGGGAVPFRGDSSCSFSHLTLAFLHGAVFTSNLPPVPVDEVARGYPYRAVVGEVTPRNPLTNDTVKLFLPWMDAAREELFALRAPLWNRYSFAGYPLLGNGESAPFSPLFLATLFVQASRTMPRSVTRGGSARSCRAMCAESPRHE